MRAHQYREPMRNLIRLDSWSENDVEHVFALADAFRSGAGPTVAGSAVMFFPSTSLRTRVTFERGAALMGLQPIVLPSETLNKDEALSDVAGYIQTWADLLVVRHGRISVMDELAVSHALPVINAMSDANHPCEVLSDLYTLRQRGDLRLRFLFVGADGNIARAWQEAARVLSLDVVQCCPESLATPNQKWVEDLHSAVQSADVIITDGPGDNGEALAPYQITSSLLDAAPTGAQFAPCPPLQTRARGQRRCSDSRFIRRTPLQGVTSSCPTSDHGLLPCRLLGPGPMRHICLWNAQKPQSGRSGSTGDDHHNEWSSQQQRDGRSS